MRSLFLLVARISIAAIFIYAGVSKLFHIQQTIAGLSHVDIPFPKIAFAGTVLLECLGGLLLALGARTQWVAFALAIFLIPVTYLFHFNLTDSSQTLNLLKNLAIFGGLLQVAMTGPGSFSLDGK